jgi:O-antigen ligase
MLLSPEINIGETAGGSLERGVTLRFEDFLLIVIGLSWFAKNAVNKELGLFLKTPLNKPIFFYILACMVSTGVGIIAGGVSAKTGSLFILKYIEYFIVFFMIVNHLEDTDQIKRFVFCLLLTCFITSIIGILQIPGGERVSAPFEGEGGEPNTFGGYLLFIGAIATGLLIKTENSKLKNILLLLILVMIPPFLFTQSRSSYLGLIPVCFVLGLLTKSRVVVLGLLTIAFLLSPLFLPSQVKNRIIFTFTQPEATGQVLLGGVRLDTSTSARLASLEDILTDWPKHPIIGYGITGYKFADAQYPRVLIETGILGLITFLYLLYSILRLAIRNMKEVKTPYFKGLTIGFLAGFIGLLFHAIGANTFIIVRIMEPFWFLAGIIVVLPTLEHQNEEQLQEERPVVRRVAPVN